MPDRILTHPFWAVAFILFVVYLVGLYLVNRERARVARLKGRRRFQPKWSRREGERRRRRRTRDPAKTFSPPWTERQSTSSERDDPESSG